MPQQLLSLQLEGFDTKYNIENVANVIDPKNIGSLFGKIQVNDSVWGLSFDAENDYYWVNPRPENRFYETLYSKLFYSSPIPEQFGYATLELDSVRRTEKAAKNWDDIEKNISIKSKNNLLEIGCGPGEFLLEAKKRGFKNVMGNELEPSSTKIALSKGLKIDQGFFENFAIENGAEKFDFIFADNVIEHTMNPLVFLKHAHSLMQEDGLLVLRLPDTQAFGPTLKLIDHTYHFTRKSMQIFLEKAGFKVETIFYSGTFKGTLYEKDNNQRIENMTAIARK